MTPDVALISLGTTPGLRHADAAFAECVRACGVECELIPVEIGASGRLRRHPAATDLVEAFAARKGASGASGRAVVFSTVTAALLADRPQVPWAVRFDSPAALNRPGMNGLWQRRQEKRVLKNADLLLPWGERAKEAIPGGSAPALAVPVPVDLTIAEGPRDIDGVAYSGYPRKRGLDALCRAWPPGRRLVIGGLDAKKGREWLERTGAPEPEGVEWAGELPRAQWLALVARARVFVNASTWEDHGLAQLEALGLGTPLVTVESPGAYEALPLARELAPELVGELPGTIEAGLAMGEAERADYARRAVALLEPYRPAAVQERIAAEVLPALGVSP